MKLKFWRNKFGKSVVSNLQAKILFNEKYVTQVDEIIG